MKFRCRLWPTFALFAGMVLTIPAQAKRVSFEFINQAVSANDMSPDGRFVVGASDIDNNGIADGTYLLDRSSNTMTILPVDGLNAVAVSDDGKVVVGDVPDPTGMGTSVAGRWMADTGWESLGFLPNAGSCPSRSNSFEVSSDGSVVVGLSWDGCSGRGFRWTEETGMVELQPLANGGNRASVVSADGSVIGGFAQGSGSRTPAVWSSDATGVLLDPPNGDRGGEIFGIRDDGSVLLGDFLYPGEFAFHATKWTSTPDGWQPERIADGSMLPGWAGTPMDIADDDTIVGFDRLLGNRRAWIQPEGNGPLVDMRTYVTTHGGTVPDGLILEVPQAISVDGRLIVGHGSFGTGAWIITTSEDCDFDANGNCDLMDIDALVQAIVEQDSDSLFDLTGDGILNLADRDAWLAQAGALNLPSGNPYLVGDANLDGTVDGVDFIEWNANKFSATGQWSLADFNADGVTDGGDFVLWNDSKFQSADISAVPEPTCHSVLIAIGALVSLRSAKHQFFIVLKKQRS